MKLLIFITLLLLPLNIDCQSWTVKKRDYQPQSGASELDCSCHICGTDGHFYSADLFLCNEFDFTDYSIDVEIIDQLGNNIEPYYFQPTGLLNPDASSGLGAYCSPFNFRFLLTFSNTSQQSQPSRPSQVRLRVKIFVGEFLVETLIVPLDICDKTIVDVIENDEAYDIINNSRNLTIPIEKYSLSSHRLEKFKVYPSQINDKIIVESFNDESKNILIFNSVGQILLNLETSDNFISINSSNFPKGIIFVKVDNAIYKLYNI